MPKRGVPSPSRSRRGERKPPSVGLAKDSPDLERRWFELDRGVVIYQLSALERTVAEGALQMEAIAMERMFEKPLSEEILHKSKAMRQAARKLKMLAAKVASATGYPKFE